MSKKRYFVTHSTRINNILTFIFFKSLKDSYMCNINKS